MAVRKEAAHTSFYPSCDVAQNEDLEMKWSRLPFSSRAYGTYTLLWWVGYTGTITEQITQQLRSSTMDWKDARMPGRQVSGDSVAEIEPENTAFFCLFPST